MGEKTKYDAASEIINLYPNPNNGNFNIEFLDPEKTDKSEIIISDLGGKQIYHETISTKDNQAIYCKYQSGIIYDGHHQEY